MRILPILFNTEMVRALLEGPKTVTRRVIKGTETSWSLQGMERHPDVFLYADGKVCTKTVKGIYATFEADPSVWVPMFKAPYEPGDILYVRETWAKKLDDRCVGNVTGVCPYENCEKSKGDCFVGEYVYKASDSLPSGEKWSPSIHMPKDAARIFLRVKSVRVERLQDITEEQARAEGFGSRAEFLKAFLAMYPDCTEESWVWVIEFERVDKPEGWPI